MKNFFFLLVVILGLAACRTPSSDTTEFNVEMRDFNFVPQTVEVRVGQTVRVNVLNKGNIEHDWAIMEIPLASKAKVADTTSLLHSHDDKEPAIHVSAIPGAKNTVEFIPTRAGLYEVYCTLKGHKEQGMVGKLVVK